MCGALGLTFGTLFDPRTVPLLFGIVVIPFTFLGCIYYPWQSLEPIPLAADPRAVQPARVHVRGLPGRAHARAAHVAVGDLSGDDRVLGAVHVAGHHELQQARALLIHDAVGGSATERIEDRNGTAPRTPTTSRTRGYQMREKLISIGDDYWIEDDAGDKVFKVDGKAARIRDTWVLEDAEGNEVAEIREKKLSIRDAIKIESRRARGDGEEGAGRHPRPVPRRGRRRRGPEGARQHRRPRYEIERDGDKIAEISKKWFRVRDTYGVEVDDDNETVLILAITVAVDSMSHDIG